MNAKNLVLKKNYFSNWNRFHALYRIRNHLPKFFKRSLKTKVISRITSPQGLVIITISGIGIYFLGRFLIHYKKNNPQKVEELKKQILNLPVKLKPLFPSFSQTQVEGP
jgi:hypothetical protein